MKKIIIHGNDYLKSYVRLNYLKDIARQRGWDITIINAKDTNLKDTLSLQSLFSKKRLLVIEDIKQLKKEAIISITNYEDPNTILIIYQNELINQNILRSIGKVDKVETYDLPKIIWTFLDSLKPGGSGEIISLFHILLNKEPVELLFHMMVQRLKDLFLININIAFEREQSWKMNRLKKQAGLIEKNKIIEILEEFSIADIRSKTSMGDMITLLDFIFAKHLK